MMISNNVHDMCHMLKLHKENHVLRVYESNWWRLGHYRPSSYLQHFRSYQGSKKSPRICLKRSGIFVPQQSCWRVKSLGISALANDFFVVHYEHISSACTLNEQKALSDDAQGVALQCHVCEAWAKFLGGSASDDFGLSKKNTGEMQSCELAGMIRLMIDEWKSSVWDSLRFIFFCTGGYVVTVMV